MATFANNPLGLTNPINQNMSVTPQKVASAAGGGTVWSSGVTTYTSGRGASYSNFSAGSPSVSSPSVTPPPLSAPTQTATFGAGGSGWQNVADTFKLIGMQTANIFGANYDLSPKGSPGATPDWLTKTITSPGFVFGAPAVVATAAPLFSSTALFGAGTGTATVSTVAGSSASKLLTPWALVGLGAVGSAFLFSGQENKATQDTSGQQDTRAQQDTTQKGGTQGMGGNDTGGSAAINNSPGATLYYNMQRYQTQYETTYNYALPTLSQTPTQELSPSQTQTSGVNWLLIAAIAAGAFVLTRK